MAKYWDGKMKRLVVERPQDFVSWLLPGARFAMEMSPHLATRAVDADCLLHVNIGGVNCILHIEFQKRSDPQMDRRLWEYNVLSTCKFRWPVISFVVYLKKDRQVANSPYQALSPNGRLIHLFHFEVIQLWDIPTELLLEADLPGLLPLLPLTKDGKRREVVEEVITRLYRNEDKPMTELLSLTYGLAALTFEQEHDQDWLKRRFAMLEDILMDTWAYKELMQRGVEKGLEQGLERGLEQGLEQGLERGMDKARVMMLKDHSTILLSYIERRYPTFPALVQLAGQCTDMISAPEEIMRIALDISVLADEGEVYVYILRLIHDKQSVVDQ